MKMQMGTSRNTALATGFLLAASLLFFTVSAPAAGVISTTITNLNGDLVKLRLNGAGTMSVSLVGTNQGPIDEIALYNTDNTSVLTINVKKSRTGSGRIAVNSITGSGSLKRMSAKSADLVGGGIELGGSVGTLMIGNLADSAITIDGAGVASGTPALSVLTAGTISNSSIDVQGNVGHVTAKQMTGSHLWSSYTPVDNTHPMVGGTFTNDSNILLVSVNGLGAAGSAAFANSTIAARSIGIVTLASVQTNNSGRAFGILADSAVKSVKIKQPKYVWKPTGPGQVALGDCQMRLPATVVITLAPTARVLTAADLSNLSYSNNVCVLSTNAPVAHNVQVGDVLVSGVGRGFLVKVLSVTPQGEAVILQTTPAKLTDVFQQAAFHQRFPFVPGEQVYLAPGVTVTTNYPSTNLRMAAHRWSPAARTSAEISAFHFVFDKPLLDTNGPVQLLLTGSADLSITPDLCVDIGLLTGLQSVSASVNVDLSTDLGLSLSAGGLYTNEVPLYKANGEPFYFLLGGWPVVVVPVLELYGGVKAKVDGECDFAATASDSYTAGLTWQQAVGWTLINDNSLQFTAGITNATVSGSLRGYLRPMITLSLYDVAGPDVYAEAGITLAGSADFVAQEFCWSLTGDLSAGAGLNVNFFGEELASTNVMVFSVEDKFAGDCFTFTNLPPSLTNGLVAHFPFDGNVQEATGLSNDGIDHGSTSVADRFGMNDRARHFTGAQYVSVPRSSAIEPPTAITVALWARLTDPSYTEQLPIISKRYNVNGPLYNSYILQPENNPSLRIGCGMIAGGVSTGVLASATMQAYVWSHLALTYDGTNLKVYQNGQLAGQGPTTGTLGYSSDDLYIGMSTPARPEQHWEGDIDDVRIYNRALSATELQQLYLGSAN